MKMKKIVLLVLGLIMATVAYAQNAFYAVSPSGHQLMYEETGNGQVMLIAIGPNSTPISGNLIIPGTVNATSSQSYTVTAINDYVFASCDALTGVSIPSTISSIGDGQFMECGALTSISVDAGNSVYDSRNSCNAIIHTATNTLISGCRTTAIPSSVTAIGEDAFYGMFTGETSDTLAIPASVSSIFEGAFSYCESLNCITVDAGNPYFDSRNGCNAIIHTATNTLVAGCRATTIPSDVTAIGAYAFLGIFATHADSITIPASVTSIGTGAFAWCEALAGITSLATTAPTLDNSPFYHVNSQIPIRIPAGSLSSYQSEWRYFSNFIQSTPDILYYTITVSSADEAMGVVSGSGSYAEGDTITLTATASEGFHFLHWQDGNSDNPRTIIVTSDSTFVAYFEADEPEGIDQVGNASIRVYPNPTTDQIHINGTFGRAELYILSGQRLLSTSESVISLEGMPCGQYLLVIDGTTTRKVIKAK